MIEFAAIFAAVATAAVSGAQPVLNGASSPPQPAAAVASSAKPQQVGDPNEMICKRTVNSGTRFATKDCRTRAEWNQLATDSAKAVQDMTSRQGGASSH